MRVLCLHGRGSNNEIFQLQTAPFRAILDDFSFEFVQGTVLHTEGNWSLYTTSFSKLPLYAYYDPLNPSSILQSEDDLLQIINEDGPFDGVLAYSGGTALASQVIIRDALEHPFKLPDERPFRFAVFINGVTPLKAMKVEDVEMGEVDPSMASLVQEAASLLIRDSAVRVRTGPAYSEDHDPESVKRELASLQTKMLPDGRPCLTNGQHAITRYDAQIDGELIDMPTLHVRCPTEEDPNHGVNLMKLCNSSRLRDHHHQYGEDFPRGHIEMKKIAELIRETAELG